MPKPRLTSLLRLLRGAPAPLPPTTAQQRQRERMRAAAVFYQQVMADPARRADYEARARATGLQVSALTLRDFMALSRPAAATRSPGSGED